MTAKQKVLSVFPTAKAVWHTDGKYPKFPRKMIQSAPRHHFLRKKHARYLKGKYRYVVINTPSLLDKGTERNLSVGSSEIIAWQRAADWFCVEVNK